MELLSVAATTVVGAGFVVAGTSKLAARERWRREAAGFGAPGWVIGPLPWIELLIGAVVLARIAVPVSVGAALTVLVVFTAAIVVNLARGRRPPCACFGAWSSSPIGWRHVVRNVILLGACGVALL